MDSVDTKLKLSPQSWDDEDDLLLIKLKEVENLGWKQIAKYFEGRTSNACQFRWRRLKSGQLKKVSKTRKLSSASSRSVSPLSQEMATSDRVLSGMTMNNTCPDLQSDHGSSPSISRTSSSASTTHSFSHGLPIPVAQVLPFPLPTAAAATAATTKSDIYLANIPQQYHIPTRIVLPPIRPLMHANTAANSCTTAAVRLPSLSQICSMVSQ